MSTRAAQFQATVRRREPLSDHLVRLVLGGARRLHLDRRSPDEWVGLVVPGQFQSRYYTVRSLRDGGELTLDVVVHDVGLVTEWAMRDCVGDTVTITEPKASFAPPPGAAWLLLVGDLTAMPAMARIAESRPDLPTYVMAEVPDDLTGYLPAGATSPGSRRRPRPGRARWPRWSRASTGPRARATSGWPASPRRCARSAST